ncbi:hypothetical protein [Mycobacterium sp.]|uniref:hypothetical protein n=1 Tax=Mycobacterium sp. TaxID=1785 RepID=UPI0025F1FBAA|nr:hypothetical protein [Mycobacterium sp.]
MRDLTTNIVTWYMVLASILNGSIMALRSEVFTSHPRFVHLDQMLHGHLEAFGAVLATAGLVKGVAALFGDGTPHLVAIKVRIIATLICGLCWSTNAYSQATNVNQTGDWPGVLGMTLLSGLFILHAGARWVYYREIRHGR